MASRDDDRSNAPPICARTRVHGLVTSRDPPSGWSRCHHCLPTRMPTRPGTPSMGDENPKRAAVRRAWRRRETRRARESARARAHGRHSERVSSSTGARRPIETCDAREGRDRARARRWVETHGRRVEGTTREGERDDAWEREDD